MSSRDLPIELIIRILGLLGPVDIVRTRMTCKSMEIASYDCNLWKEIFSYACTRHRVVDGSYDIPTMTRKELEHASLHPYQFARRAFRSRTEDGFYCANLLLIPGGRFLLTSQHQKSISLWDLKSLEIRDNVTANLVPLASLRFDNLKELEGRFIRDMHASTTSDGKSIRVIFGALTDPFAFECELYAYEISPADNSPTFHFLRVSTSRFRTPVVGAFDGDRVILEMSSHNGRTAIWDINTDSTISWRPDILDTATLDYPSSYRPVSAILLHGNRFARFQSIKEVAVHDLPIQPHGVDSHSDVAPPRIATLNATATPLGEEFGSEVSYSFSQPGFSNRPFAPAEILECIQHSPFYAPTNTLIMRLSLLDCEGPSPRLTDVLSIARSDVTLFGPVKHLPRAYMVGDSYAILWIEDAPHQPDILPFRFYVTEPSNNLNMKQLEGNHVALAEMTREALSSTGRNVQFCSLSGRLVVQDEVGHIIIRDYYGT